MFAKLAILVLVGMAVGGQLNRAIYTWAWNRRSISPWSAPPAGVIPRAWFDCIPVVGWWFMRRESALHGPGFWLRPLLIELAFGFGLATLYWWEVIDGQMLPRSPLPPLAEMTGTLHATFVANAILFALMTIATFIDIDEKTIPDYITVPGTLIALAFSIVWTDSLLPIPPSDFAATGDSAQPVSPSPILISAPNPWPASFDSSTGLSIGLLCWAGWCFALLPKTVYWRRGFARGCRFLLASIYRNRLSYWIGGMAIVGGAIILFIYTQGGTAWQALLSSLAGLAFGGGLVWAIRIISGYALGVEAMGFGDVTLMAMIGAFLGWQAAMITFFLAPFTSLAIALTQWMVTGRRDIPFGPFLCAAASIVIVFWGDVWHGWGQAFALGSWILGILAVCMCLMGLMLGMLQLVKRLLGIAPTIR